jgi:hypothetical protein
VPLAVARFIKIDKHVTDSGAFNVTSYINKTRSSSSHICALWKRGKKKREKKKKEKRGKKERKREEERGRERKREKERREKEKREEEKRRKKRNVRARYIIGYCY